MEKNIILIGMPGDSPTYNPKMGVSCVVSPLNEKYSIKEGAFNEPRPAG